MIIITSKSSLVKKVVKVERTHYVCKAKMSKETYDLQNVASCKN